MALWICSQHNYFLEYMLTAVYNQERSLYCNKLLIPNSLTNIHFMKGDHMPGNSPLYTAPKSSSDFWKFWAGQSISTLGSSFTGFALPLLIFKLTGSPLDLSFTVAASVLPYLFFGLVIGAWVDRVNRKRLMILTDLAR